MALMAIKRQEFEFVLEMRGDRHSHESCEGCGWQVLSSSKYHHHVDVEPQLRLSFLPL
jgi:hypothetical protein